MTEQMPMVAEYREQQAEARARTRVVFVPAEHPIKGGGSVLMTFDRTRYVRDENNVLRRHIPKVRGKAAVKAHKRARQAARVRP
jgi:hypothetical protein